MKKDLKKLLILNLPFLFIWYFADKISWLYRMVDAKNAGMKTVLVPAKNERDVEEISTEITKGLEIKFVTHMDEVLKEALV